jgi:hypothetical protein
MPNSIPTKTSFKIGHIRSQESIVKQSNTMKKQFKSGLRNTSGRFLELSYLPKPKPKQIRLCEKCNAEYKPDNGTQRWCKKCVPDKQHRFYMQRYNLSKDEHDNLLIINNGMCWICLKRKAIVVDHDHNTGKVRGLLCGHCNMALSIVENKEILERAIKYVSIS